MKCPNPYCGGKLNQHIGSDGGGSLYCLDGCGYYREFPPGTQAPPPQETVAPRKKKP